VIKFLPIHKVVTLYELERSNSCVISPNKRPIISTWLTSRQKYSPRKLVFGIYGLSLYSQRLRRKNALNRATPTPKRKFDHTTR